MDYVNDGIHFTESQILDCIDGNDFDFPKYRSGRIRSIPARQYVYRPTGAVFIRTIRDLQGWMIIVFIENTRLPTKDDSHGQMKRAYEEILQWSALKNN